MPELKNTSRAQRAGFQAEKNVIRLLKTKKWTLIFQRAKTKVAEVDLIFENENKILLIEVKTLSNPWRAFDRVRQSQISKLKANLVLFSKAYPAANIRAFVAWVEPDQRISFSEIN